LVPRELLLMLLSMYARYLEEQGESSARIPIITVVPRKTSSIQPEISQDAPLERLDRQRAIRNTTKGEAP
jgi:hypothetical protein